MKDAEEIAKDIYIHHFDDDKNYPSVLQAITVGVQKGAELKNKIEWFDATKVIPLPKKLEMYRYTTEAISDKGDLVCYDYKDKCWKKLVIEDKKVTYVPVEIKMWCNKPTKESE